MKKKILALILAAAMVFTLCACEASSEHTSTTTVTTSKTDADGNTAGSAAMFGDSTDKRVVFDGDISRFAGRPVTLECDMRDADLYSIRFA